MVELHLEDGEGQCLVVGVVMVDQIGLLDIAYLAWLMLGRAVIVVMMPEHDLLAALLEGNVATGLVGRRWHCHPNTARFLR